MGKEKKRYKIQSGCPQCGCSFCTVLTKEELQERYGNVPNFDLECGECMANFSRRPRMPARSGTGMSNEGMIRAGYPKALSALRTSMAAM